MWTEENGFGCDMEVFENSGKNLAEYLLNRQGTKGTRRRLFKARDEEDDEVSIRFIEKRQTFSIPQPNTPSSSSSLNATFKRFKPSIASTPFPGANRMSQLRKIVSIANPHHPERFVNSEKTPERNSRRISRSSRTSDLPSPHGSHDGSRRPITANSPELNPTPPCPPYAAEPVGSSAEDEPEVPNSVNVQTNTNREIQRMEISEPAKKVSSETSQKTRHKTVTTPITIDHDYLISSCSSDEGDATLVPQTTEQPQKEMTPVTDLRAPQQKDDTTSGFVHFSTQSTRTTTNKPKSGIAPIATGNKSVIQEMPEESTTSNQQSQLPLVPTATSTVTNDSRTFKAPLATKKRIRKKRKLDSPLVRMIQLENTIRQSVPRELGTSKRKLYSKGSEEYTNEALVDNSGSKDSVSNELEQQQQEHEIELDSEELMEAEAEVFDASNIVQPCYISVEHLNISDLVKSLTEQEQQKQKKDKKNKKEKEDKKGKEKKDKKEKKNKKKKEQENEMMEKEKLLKEQEGNIPLRRSQRKRFAPVPFWLGTQHSPLIVKSYDEEMDLKKRYVKEGSDSTPVIKGDFTVLKEKKAKKKKKSRPRKGTKFYSAQNHKNQKNTKQTEVFEPQLDAEREERTQSPEKVLKVQEKQSQLPKAKDKSNKKNTDEKNDDQKRTEQYLASPSIQSSVSVLSFGDELNNLSETDKLLGALLINSASNVCEYFVKRTNGGIHIFTARGHDGCGYFLFEPGVKKKCCRVIQECLYLVVVKGNFLTKINGSTKEVNENDVIVLQRGSKYELTYSEHNGEQGKLLFFYVET